MKATDVVAAALEAAPDALFVSSLGTATSALRKASDDGPHLYLGGAMGCGLATALGVADRCPERSVIAVVGDGDLLMGAGSLWSLSGLRQANMLALVLSDGHFTITGGQPLVAPTVLASVAAGFPGLEVVEAETPAAVGGAVRTLRRPALCAALVDERVFPGPSPFVDPPAVRARFAEHAARSA